MVFLPDTAANFVKANKKGNRTINGTGIFLISDFTSSAQMNSFSLSFQPRSGCCSISESPQSFSGGYSWDALSDAFPDAKETAGDGWRISFNWLPIRQS